MRSVQIGFSSHKGFAPFGWAIQLYEQTPYSHVYFKIDTKWKTSLIYQASGAMVNFMAGAVFYENNLVYDEFNFEISDEAYDKFMTWATTVCGRPYSKCQILGFLIKDLFNLKKNPLCNGQKAWVCAELVSYALGDIIGIEIGNDIFENATPYDLYKICKKLNFKEKI